MTYVCEEGYYFEENFYMKDFTVMCTRDPDGSWEELPDKRCLDPASEMLTTMSELLRYIFFSST